MSVELFEFYVNRAGELESAIKWYRIWFEYLTLEDKERIFKRDRFNRALIRLGKARERMNSLV